VDNFCYGPCDWKTYLWNWTDWFVRIDIVLLGLMFLYVLVIGGRGFFLNYFGRRQSRLFLIEANAAMGSGAFDVVISIARRYPGSPLAKVASAGLQASVPLLSTLASTDIGEVSARAFQRSRVQIIRVMNFGMNPVRAIGYVAPLVGLAGTCFGLLDAFRGAGMEHYAYLAMTTSLAAYALIPAAAGLIVAIPAVAVDNLLQTSLDNLNSEMLALSLNAVSLLASRAQILNAAESQHDSSGYTTFLSPKFPLQRPFSELLGPALATAFALVTVSWTAIADPYLSKGLEVRLLNPNAPERAVSSFLTIDLMEQTDASSRIVYLNKKKTRLEALGALLQEQRGPTACVRAQSDVPWADVAGAIDAAKGPGREVILLTNTPSKKHKSAKKRE
jgi:biopolymer transport protein ExbB/TolQ